MVRESESARAMRQVVDAYARKVIRQRRDIFLDALDRTFESNPSPGRKIVVDNARQWINMFSEALLEDFDRDF